MEFFDILYKDCARSFRNLYFIICAIVFIIGLLSYIANFMSIFYIAIGFFIGTTIFYIIGIVLIWTTNRIIR